MAEDENTTAARKAAAVKPAPKDPKTLFTDPDSISAQIWRAMWDSGTE
jgi:hypothetical protein